MDAIIEELERRKILVHTKAEEYCRALDLVMELIADDGLPNAPDVPSGTGTGVPSGTNEALRSERPARNPAPAANDHAARSRSSFALLVDQVSQLPEPINSSACILAVPGLSKQRAADYLGRLVKDGTLRRIGYGKYERSNGHAKPPDPAPEENVKARGSGSPRYPMRRPENQIAAAVREIAAGLPEPFSLLNVLPQLMAHPHAKGRTDENLKAMAVAALIDLREKGLLEPAGPGRPTIYRRTRLWDTPPKHAARPPERIELDASQLHNEVES